MFNNPICLSDGSLRSYVANLMPKLKYFNDSLITEEERRSAVSLFGSFPFESPRGDGAGRYRIMSAPAGVERKRGGAGGVEIADRRGVVDNIVSALRSETAGGVSGGTGVGSGVGTGVGGDRGYRQRAVEGAMGVGVGVGAGRKERLDTSQSLSPSPPPFSLIDPYPAFAPSSSTIPSLHPLTLATHTLTPNRTSTHGISPLISPSSPSSPNSPASNSHAIFSSHSSEPLSPGVATVTREAERAAIRLREEERMFREEERIFHETVEKIFRKIFHDTVESHSNRAVR